ncbi:MAG: hypothetical protein HQM14_02905 [SAR324 cluster bacterium]|nr:hypothetical protein [SAR324 cluster bacterium]
MTQEFENLECQQGYAMLLKRISNLGLVLLFLTFGLYIFGVLEPLIPLEKLPQYWNLPLNEYIEQSGAPIGWGWLNHLGNGDYLSFIGLILLAAVDGICYVFLFIFFTKKKKRLYMALVSVELFLILLSASNLMQFGH